MAHGNGKCVEESGPAWLRPEETKSLAWAPSPPSHSSTHCAGLYFHPLVKEDGCWQPWLHISLVPRLRQKAAPVDKSLQASD